MFYRAWKSIMHPSCLGLQAVISVNAAIMDTNILESTKKIWQAGIEQVKYTFRKVCIFDLFLNNGKNFLVG